MRCEAVLDVIEEIAAGERDVAPAVSAHLATCADCTAALEWARRVDRLLAARPQPEPPPDFARAVIARVRRERWREEERFDLAFNVGLGIAGTLIALGILAAVNVSGVAAVLGDVSAMLAQSANVMASRFALPPGLVSGIVVLVSLGALAWWWAEDRYSW